MKKITQEKLDQILEKHEKWVQKEIGKVVDAYLQASDYQEEAIEGLEFPERDVKNTGMKLFFSDCADLRNHDLSGLDLRGANLKCARLDGANLSGAILQEANLTAANLTGANLEEACLSRATLNCANMTSVNLKKADLKSAEFFGTELNGANLQGAILKNTDLGYAKLENVNFEKANLRAARLWGKELRGVNFKEANLMFADLRHAKLEGADLTGANLSGVKLENANLKAANLEKAHLTGVDLKNVSNLGHANLNGVIYKAVDFERFLKLACTEVKKLPQISVPDGSEIEPANKQKSNDIMRDYKIEAAKIIGKKTHWSGPDADVEIAQALLVKGYERHQIHHAINKLSPETADKPPLEMTKYSQGITEKALTPEIKKQITLQNLSKDNFRER